MGIIFTKPDFSISTYQTMRVRVSRRKIFGVPEALDGLKIVFASDFHAREALKVTPWIEAIKIEQPHLVLYGGDFADTKPQALRVLAEMKSVKPQYGSFAVIGNNDVEAFKNADTYRRELEQVGCTLLYNEARVLAIDGEKVILSGVGEKPHLAKQWQSALTETNGYRICLSHYAVKPLVDEAHMPNLLLCGHTHGGQFNGLGLTPYSIGYECSAENGMYKPFAVSGWKKMGHTLGLVSKGIGMSKIPLRIGVRSEIHSIVLCAK